MPVAAVTARALRTLLERSPTFTTTEALRAGLAPRDLYAMRDSGDLIELSRGVFRSAKAGATAHSALLAVSRRAPKGIICLVSALGYWELTDELPGEVHLAIARGSSRPKIAYPPSAIHVFDRATFRLGAVEEHLTKRETIAIYSPERTVVDMMRLRNRLGRDVALRALQRYLGAPRSKPAAVLRLARQLRVERPIADALEVLAP
jgi:predicted transcriptional regulator of viral defense system